MEALKEALLGSYYRCIILTRKWEALVREIRDELVHNDPALDALLNRITQDHYVLRQEKRKGKKDGDDHNS